VRETNETERIVEVNIEPFKPIIKIDHFSDFQDSSSKSKNESKEKWEIWFVQLVFHPFSTKQIISKA